MIGINVDITEREEAEQARQQAERHRELLIAELNHRVKNTLAVVQGIAHQTFKGSDEKARKAFEGRLVALSMAHNLLTQANWENASLHQLVADSLQTAASQSSRIIKNGPNVLLPPRQALAIALALHELFTNAVKYGALSNDTGVIELTWTIRQNGSRHVDMEWRERGGPPVEKPARRGFGSVLLERTLAMDLNGDVKTEFGPQGLVCNISFEL
jgi:two-component sensor histidine kinase